MLPLSPNATSPEKPSLLPKAISHSILLSCLQATYHVCLLPRK